MTSVRPVITVKIDAMRRFRDSVTAGLGGGGGGKGVAPGSASSGGSPFDAWRKAVEKRYSTFVTARFAQFSRGGGDWPALALSTIAARRGPARGRGGKGGGSGGGSGARISMGRETYAGLRRRGVSAYDARRIAGTLRQTGRTVSILVDTGILMRAVGMNGAGHRTTRLPNGIQYGFNETPHRGGVTVVQLAAYHHFGRGHNPRRPILVEPSAAVVAGMKQDLASAVAKAIAQSRAGGRR